MEKKIIIIVNTLILIGLLLLIWGNVFFLYAMGINPYGWPVEVLACASSSAVAWAIHDKIKLRYR